MSYLSLLQMALNAALRGAEEILKVYETDFSVEIKQDASPVTIADRKASKVIISHLAQSGINVVSEEENFPSYEIRREWERVWIVDPLDGTKEFIKRNGEFTINIALVEGNKPVIGVIYSPVFRTLYFAAEGLGSYKMKGTALLELEDSPDVIHIISRAAKLPVQPLPSAYTLVASRSHLSKEISERIKRMKLEHNSVEIINTGSSIKFCLIAEGIAHEYPRFGTTMEWDTAAGQCIIEQTGGRVIDLSTGLPMKYNREDLRNNNFIAFCKN